MATPTYHAHPLHQHHRIRPQYCPAALPAPRGRRISVWDRVQLQGCSSASSSSSSSSVWHRLGSSAPTKSKINGHSIVSKSHYQIPPSPAALKSNKIPPTPAALKSNKIPPTPAALKSNHISNHVVQKVIAQPNHTKLQKNIAQPGDLKLQKKNAKSSDDEKPKHHQTKNPSAPTAAASPILKPAQTTSSPNLKPHEKLTSKVTKSCYYRNTTAKMPPQMKSSPVLRAQKLANHNPAAGPAINKVTSDEAPKTKQNVGHKNAGNTNQAGIKKVSKGITQDSSKRNIEEPCLKRKATDVYDTTQHESGAVQPLKRNRVAIPSNQHDHIHSNDADTKKRKRVHMIQDEDELVYFAHSKRSFDSEQLNTLTELLTGRIQQLHII